MDAKPFAILRRIKASPRAVWRALTVPEELERWLSPSDRYAPVMEEMHDGGGGHYHLTLESPANRARVKFELTPAADRTELLVTHWIAAEERQWQARIRRLARHVEIR